MRRLAMRLVADVHRAEDVAQAALSEALRNPPPFADDPPRMRRWLGGVVRHEARDAVGREAERGWRERRAARPEALELDSSPELRETRDALLAGLEQLPEKDRQILVWHYFEGQTVAVIGVLEGISPAATRKRIERARARLRDWLDRHYGDRGTWCVALASLAREPAAAGGMTAIRVWVTVGLLVAAGLAGLAAQHFTGRGNGVVLALSPEVPAEAIPGGISAAATGPRGPARAVRGLVGQPELGGAPRPTALVLAGDGRALAGATVVARDGSGGGTWTGTSGADGRVTLPAGAGAQWLAAGMPGHVASALSPGWDSRGGHLVLQDAQPLAGRVRGTPRGGAPGPTSLALTSNLDPLGPAPPWVANGLRRAGVPGRLPYAVALDSAGAWSVDGVPAGWSGRLHAPAHTWFAELPAEVDRLRRNAVEVREPRAGLAFRVQGLPRAAGQVVDRESGEPLFLADVRLVPHIEGDTARRTFGTQTRADGGFELSYGPGSIHLEAAWALDPLPLIERVELVVEHEGFLAQRVTLEDPGAGRWDPWNTDLGSIQLEPIPAFAATVAARGGDPLTGALGLAGSTISRPARKDGRVRMQVVSRDDTVWAAPDHRRRRWAVTRGGLERIELEPGGTVILRLTGAGDRQPSDADRFGVELLARSLPYAGAEAGQGFPVPIGLPAQAGFVGPEPGAAGPWRMDMVLDVEGRARLSGFDPGVALEFVVRDRFGRMLGQVSGTTPRGPDSLELDVVLARVPQALCVRVVDSGGVPIPQASVLAQVGEVRRRLLADRTGQLELASCADAVADLCLDVSAGGFASRRFEGRTWRPGDDTLVVELERARPLRLSVKLPSGADPADTQVWSEVAGGLRLAGRPVEPGVYVFDVAPGAEVRLILQQGEVQLSRLVPPGLREFEIVVPSAR